MKFCYTDPVTWNVITVSDQWLQNSTTKAFWKTNNCIWRGSKKYTLSIRKIWKIICNVKNSQWIRVLLWVWKIVTFHLCFTIRYEHIFLPLIHVKAAIELLLYSAKFWKETFVNWTLFTNKSSLNFLIWLLIKFYILAWHCWSSFDLWQEA